MKVAVPKSDGYQKKSVKILLSLVDDESSHKVTKANSLSFEAKVSPTEADSSTYKLVIRILDGSESIRQLIRWRDDIFKVMNGLNATTVKKSRPLITTLMRSGCQATFNKHVADLAKYRYGVALNAAIRSDRIRNDNLNTDRDQVVANGQDHYLEDSDMETSVNRLLTSLLPRQVLAKVKRNLRRDMRKPYDMPIRTYYQHLLRINKEELAKLPPLFEKEQSLNDGEFIDVLLFGTPRSWQNEMDHQGFDHMEKTPDEVVAFMENIEASEEVPDKPKASTKSDKTPKKKKNTSSESKKKFFCTEHGENWTHDTKDCRILQKKKDGGGYPNKTWNRKSDDAKKEAKKELATLIAKSVKHSVKKELAAVVKKRKSDDDTDDEKDGFLLDCLQGKLDGFNYEEMENLSIDDDDEINV